MLKECKVILNNEDCTVVDVDGKLVQLPPVKTGSQFIRIKLENGVYSLAEDEIVQEDKPVEVKKVAEKKKRKKRVEPKVESDKIVSTEVAE